MKPPDKMKNFQTLLIIFLVFVITSSYISNKTAQKYSPKFTIKLKNILESDDKLRDLKSDHIFLIETHLEQERTLNDPRQACTVESAALMNPNYEVYLIFATNSDNVNLELNEIIFRLSFYENIKFAFINPIEFSKSSKLENFFKSKKLKFSPFKLEHLSDALRVLLLNKYGGQYLDLDIFSLKPLSEIRRKNFACALSDDLVNQCILNLDTNENRGVKISNKYLEYGFKEKNFN